MENFHNELLAIISSCTGLALFLASFFTGQEVVEDEDAPYLDMYRSAWKVIRFATFCLTLSFIFILFEGLLIVVSFKTGNWPIVGLTICGIISTFASFTGFCFIECKRKENQKKREERYDF